MFVVVGVPEFAGDAAVVDDEHPVRHAHEFGQVGGDEENGCAGLAELR